MGVCIGYRVGFFFCLVVGDVMLFLVDGVGGG